ncbi:MAG: hypothetical protein INF12_14795 [Methylobacterium sp.]|nr:hypothetical protein [Methylobacterium sp.]
MIATGTLRLPISDAVSARVEWEAEIRVLASVMRDDPADDREVEMLAVDIYLDDETSDYKIKLDDDAARALGLYKRANDAAEQAAHEAEIEE